MSDSTGDLKGIDEKPNSAYFDEAVALLERSLSVFERCGPEERAALRQDLEHLRSMESKLTAGRVEIAVFGEISTGKSALINALIGRPVAEVNVRGGWTKDARSLAWENGYHIPGLGNSQVILIDTPGLNEVEGEKRASIAREVARRADLILFVTDSDLNETEYSALVALASVNKPIIVVLNKIDLYTDEERIRLLEILRQERLRLIRISGDIVCTAVDPRTVEHVIVDAQGREKSEWRKPPIHVEDLKVRILEVLERDGLDLVALNAALFAADTNDRVAQLRVQLRNNRANGAIWSFAAVKALVVSLNPIPVADILGGLAIDGTMVVTLAHLYGLSLNRSHAHRLIRSIAHAAGWVMVGEYITHLLSLTMKGLTLGIITPLSAIPQGAAAGYGSYIVGQAAKYYFEHGASWGPEGAKQVVRRILEQTDKESVIEHLKDEIRRKLDRNQHSSRN
ncbi:MAG: GTP-binding protein [Planctomycetota bacterium]|nr:GTP-binding protein [Planctomycetota bacterium]